MIKKAVKGAIVASFIVLVPVLGNLEILGYAHLWILFCLGILASIFQPDYDVVKKEKKNRDRGTELQIIWSVFTTQLLIILEAAYVRFPDSVRWDTLTVAAFLMMVLGLVLRTWSVYTLGKFFTMHLDIQESHKIIRSGPYRYFRHPSYAGAFLTYTATPVFLHAWNSLIPVIIILSIAWLRRMHYEEKMLIEELGKEYVSYCKTVKRIIPGIW
jgi:protein-S-isoprenylcysteine O-methyltransferase Ste14